MASHLYFTFHILQISDWSSFILHCLFCRWHVRKKTLNLLNLSRENYGELDEDYSSGIFLITVKKQTNKQTWKHGIYFSLSRSLSAGLTSLLSRITSYILLCRKESAPLVRGFSSDLHSAMWNHSVSASTAWCIM